MVQKYDCGTGCFVTFVTKVFALQDNLLLSAGLCEFFQGYI